MDKKKKVREIAPAEDFQAPNQTHHMPRPAELQPPNDGGSWSQNMPHPADQEDHKVDGTEGDESSMKINDILDLSQNEN